MPRINRLQSFCIFTAINFIFAAVLYGGYCAYRSYTLYCHLKVPARGLQGSVYRADPVLGYAAVPGARGAHLLPPEPAIPIRYDADGFRVPSGYASNSSEPRQRPLVLALGCSYTYGDACRAEDAFVWRVGRQLNGSSINAGQCGYGLCQMLVLARRLIPRYKPDYVLVQYSPWLIQRAQSYFAPSFYGRITNPYFSPSDSGLSIQPPVFAPAIFSLPLDRYRTSPKSIADMLSFEINVGFPLSIYEDFKMLAYHVKRRMGFIPDPARNTSAIIHDTYGEIIRLARSSGSQPLIIVLGDGVNPVPVPQELSSLEAPVVDAYAALMQRLPLQTTGAYAHAYVHWNAGDPPMVIDAHPNPKAHAIIAAEVINAIRRDPGYAAPQVHGQGMRQPAPAEPLTTFPRATSAQER